MFAVLIATAYYRIIVKPPPTLYCCYRWFEIKAHVIAYDNRLRHHCNDIFIVNLLSTTQARGSSITARTPLSTTNLIFLDRPEEPHCKRHRNIIVDNSGLLLNWLMQYAITVP